MSSHLTKLCYKNIGQVPFKGSTEVGKKVAAKAAGNLISTTLELGGKSPTIVDDTANVDVAARRICWGKVRGSSEFEHVKKELLKYSRSFRIKRIKLREHRSFLKLNRNFQFLNSGQVCIAPDYVVVHKSRKQELITSVKKYIREFYSEDPLKSPDYARIVNSRNFDRVKKLLESGGKVIFGGETNEESRYISPTLLDEVSFQSEIMESQNEVSNLGLIHGLEN